MTRFATPAVIDEALLSLPAADERAIAAARERQASLTKPAGSLGRLEDIAAFMAGWQRRAAPSAKRIQCIVFAGNHGVAARGVSAFPAEVTAQMVANFREGGAAINALAGACGAELTIVPLDLDRATGDIASAPAMSEPECLAAFNAGCEAVADGIDLLIVGEMGIANTTPAAALCAAAFGGNAADWVGKGTGVEESGLTRKTKAVDFALARHRSKCVTPFETLRRVGGREIAAMAGAVLAARMQRVPVLLDGFICGAALAPLAAAAPSITEHCLAGHCSAEAGHARLLKHLGLEPLLNLGMRLGEGSGAAVAAQIVRSALAAHSQMASFAEAAVAQAQTQAKAQASGQAK